MRIWAIFLLALIGTWWIDQGIKELFLGGYQWQSHCISLELHLNRGVAFSLFSSLGAWLKWIQIALISGLFLFFLKDGWIRTNPFPIGVLLGSAVSNLYDRFIHGGVVDYVYWHCGFDFAIFNYADVMIDLSVLWLFLAYWLQNKKHIGENSDPS